MTTLHLEWNDDMIADVTQGIDREIRAVRSELFPNGALPDFDSPTTKMGLDKIDRLTRARDALQAH